MGCAGDSRKRKVLGPHLTSTGTKLVPTGWELAVVPLERREAGSAKWGGGGGESSGEEICIWCVMLL